MTRVPVAVLAGVLMALGLFWLLSLLVSPPEQEIEVLEMSMPLTSVEAPEAEPEAAEPPAEPAPPEAPEPVSAPPPPEPAPLAESPLALPDPELPPEEPEAAELDSELPELAEARPEPEPEPEPKPEPEPEPESRSESTAESTPDATAGRPGSDAAASEAPVDVGQAAPTERVPPEYPARAQRRGLEGHVEVEFVIRADGSVDPSSIRVLSARPRNVFDDAARQAVARWRFEPAERLRRASQRLEFQLR